MPEPLTLRTEPSEQTRDLTLRTFQVRAETVNDKERSVEAIFATEDPVAVFDMRTYAIIDEVLRMDGAELPEQVPMLDNHFRWSNDDVFGSARGASLRGKTTVGSLVFADVGDERIDKAWKKVQQGHQRDVSAGYRTIEYTDIPAGQRGIVKGKEYRAKDRTLRVTTKWQLREVSLVPFGADPRAKIREETGAHDERLFPKNAKESTMNPRLRAYLEKMGLRKEATEEQANAFLAGLSQQQRSVADVLGQEALTDTVRSAALRGLGVDPEDPSKAITPAPQPEGQRSAGPATPPAVPPTPPSPDEVQRAAVTAERQRVARIRELAAGDVPAELRERAEAEGWDENRASREFLAAVRERRAPPVGPGIHSRSHEGDCNLRSLSAGLLISQGLDPLTARSHDGRRPTRATFTEQEADLGDRYRGLAFIDVLRECVRLDTGRYSIDWDDTLRAAVSGASFSHVFGTNVYARLIAGWEKVGDTTLGWCDEEDVCRPIQIKPSERFVPGVFSCAL